MTVIDNVKKSEPVRGISEQEKQRLLKLHDNMFKDWRKAYETDKRRRK